MLPILLSLFFVNGKANEEKLFRLGPNCFNSREIPLFFSEGRGAGGGGAEPFKSQLKFLM